MQLHRSTVLLIASALVGCVSRIESDSTHFLPLERATSVVRIPADDAAAELAELFAVRGFPLVDREPGAVPGSAELTLSGPRGRVRNGALAYEVGSVFRATVVPTAIGATVAVLGKSTVDGHEPCTAGDPRAHECSVLAIDPTVSDVVTGEHEAATIHSVLTELELRAGARPAEPAAIAAGNLRAVRAWLRARDHVAYARADCKARRRARFAEAEAEPNLVRRGRLFASLPRCEPLP